MKILKSVGIFLLGIIAILVLYLYLFAPGSLGLNSRNKIVHQDYNNPKNFTYTKYTGLKKLEVHGVDLYDENPIFVIVQDDLVYEVYYGDYHIENYWNEFPWVTLDGFDMSLYNRITAIGITVYKDDEIVCKQLLDGYPVKQEYYFSTDNGLSLFFTYLYEGETFVRRIGLSLQKVGTGSEMDEWYYSRRNEVPKREYYIPFDIETYKVES